jgi:ribonuclease Z
LLQSGLRLGQVDALFLTHLHSDHVVGIPDLWLTGWLEATYSISKSSVSLLLRLVVRALPAASRLAQMIWKRTYAQRQGPFVVYGPTGTQALMDGLISAYQWDIKARIAEQNLSPASIAVQVTEFKESLIYDQGGVKVSAIEVDHGELLKPAFGFRVDYAGRPVTVSGDTRFSEKPDPQSARHRLDHSPSRGST